jgi:hypothetical protein
MNYDATKGSHDNLEPEHPIDKAKAVMARQMETFKRTNNEAAAIGMSREEIYEMMYRVTEAALLDMGSDRATEYVTALIALQLDL